MMWKQGERVRMVAAPAPCFEPFVGWEWVIVRASWRRLEVRLRADYKHTGGHILEMLYAFPHGATYFEVIKATSACRRW